MKIDIQSNPLLGDNYIMIGPIAYDLITSKPETAIEMVAAGQRGIIEELGKQIQLRDGRIAALQTALAASGKTITPGWGQT